MRISLLAAFSVGLAACATTQPAPAAVPVARAEPAIAPIAKVPASGVIPRRALEQFLDDSPGVFLQHVDTEPRFVGGRFAGWKLRAFFPGDARFAGIDLRAGDVIERVNGSSLERPEQLMNLWRALRVAPQLTVELERDGQKRTLSWAIEGQLPAPPASATIAP
jgi:general secretion pathway protein C